jgi:hypothetical protein
VRLSTDGDQTERLYWDKFAADWFPSYESFWLQRVVPLTRRGIDRRDIGFLSREEMVEGTDEAVALAQLHYTTLVHLGRVYDLLHEPQLQHRTPPHDVLSGPGSAVLSAPALSATAAIEPAAGAATWAEARAPVSRSTCEFDFDRFVEAFARLAAANDVADELLERHTAPGTYDPWDERQGNSARRAWRAKQGDPLKPIRDYRNRLLHGRVAPEVIAGNIHWYPRIDKIDDYLDWRRVFADEAAQAILDDFGPGRTIVMGAWERTVSYLERSWSTHLLI